MAKEEIKKEPVEEKKEEEKKTPTFSPSIIGAIADEVSRTLLSRLPSMMPRRAKKKAKKTTKIDDGIFFDTSAIIDGRIFDVIYLGLLNGTVVLTPNILLELKHLADTQDTVKRVRGRKGLEALENLRKSKKIKVTVLPDDQEKPYRDNTEVDEQLIKIAKYHRGKVVTCDYNLEKKASIEGVTAINMNALANCLKVIAVPGESLHIKISHQGKDPTQGVGYLDDGTMIVVEEGSGEIGKALDVVVARIIQTATGRILFAKRI
ncbi:MAG: hypothetical protein H0W89_05415 [Candidatus Levybacteria bacterium]|nr:hypothetical protein [Candidatus Levybacteria bacterium]